MGQLEALFTWLQDPSIRHLNKRSREKEHAKGRLDQNTNRNLSLARTNFVAGWGTLLPWVREGAVETLLAAYCRSRACRTSYSHYDKLTYRTLCGPIGRFIEQREAELAAEENDASPYVQVVELVRAIEVASSYSSSPTDPDAVRLWATAFMSASGITRVKLERLKAEAQRDLVYEVRVVLAGVKECIHAGWSLDRVLLSADIVFSRAYAATQPPSTRFDKLVNILDCLIILYRSSANTAADVEQLEKARALLDHRMPVGVHPVVLTRRVGEVHLAGLPLDQQVAAVENARDLLFSMCREHHEQKPLPSSSVLLEHFFAALQHPELLRGARLGLENAAYSSSSPPSPAPLVDSTWPAYLAQRPDWRLPRAAQTPHHYS
ncbi:hypothetical protein JCM3775_002840 [Rhodotorula graminis]